MEISHDCQQMAYVLDDNEKNVPMYLKDAFDDANLLQDILTSNFIEGSGISKGMLSTFQKMVRLFFLIDHGIIGQLLNLLIVSVQKNNMKIL